MSSTSHQARLPAQLFRATQIFGTRLSRFIVAVSVRDQRMSLFERATVQSTASRWPQYSFRKRFQISTSVFGIGQVMHSNQTPLGLHRIAKKVGGGRPVGTVFRGRQPVGLTWQGLPEASIVHRILWLEGLEPGLNRGGNVDTFSRYIYIHGFGDETTLGRPKSHGCIHVAASDLLPLYDLLPQGTLVWIGGT